MKEKGDPCILVGYSTQSKGYRVYNKRTRLIVESIHLKFNEIKEMSKTFVANDTSGLVSQRQKASDYDNSNPDPQLQNVSPSEDTIVTSQLELDLLFGPLYDEFFNAGALRVNKSSSPTDNSAQQDTLPLTNIHPTTEPSTPTHVNAKENNNDQEEFTNPFCTPLLTRVLRIILVIMPEHPSDTYVLTMKMEILLEPASNKLLVGDSLNLPDHRILRWGDGDAFSAGVESLPHAHAQTTKTYYKHQDSRIMKAQELKTKTSAQTLIYKIFLQRYQVYQGRLLASFQDDAKYEHVGQDTRSQGGKDDQDKQGKDLKISKRKDKVKRQ
ncbi:hypothetical protein Tco_0003418 [Tanacetum coccineum]